MRPRVLISVAGIAAIAAGGWALKGPILKWRVRRLLVTAASLQQTGDQRGAVLTARAILQSEPDNIAACRIMAQAAEEDRSPLGIEWRQQLARLQPNEAGPLLDLAKTAIAVGEAGVAEGALDQVPEGTRDTAAFHDTAAAWALSIQQYGLGLAHAAAAVRCDPRNPRLKMSLAALQLAEGGTAADGARKELEAMEQQPEYKLEAMRDLLADARRRGDASTGLTLALALSADAGATVADRLQYLEEMQRAGSADFDRKLANLQASSAQPGPAYAIMEWMSGHGLAARAWQWHTTLPVASRKMPEPLAAADVCIAQGDWESLRDLVHGEQWGDLEFLRLAYETRAYDEVSRHERGPDFHNRWQRTMISTGGSPNALSMLARVAQSWGWQDEAAQVWWLVAARPVGQRPALAALYAMASARKDTAELYRVAKRLLELEPASPVAKNNAAMFALLLRRDLPEAHKLAEEDYAAAPTEAPIASTYAFSLYLQGRVAEGVAVMARLPQTALSDASVAACDGVLLAAAGDREKARPLLEQAERNKQSLLPEERAMVEEALGKL